MKSKVFVIQTNEANNIASVMDPRTGQLLFAGPFSDVINFVSDDLNKIVEDEK